MTPADKVRSWLAARLAVHAACRLRRRHPEWADAVMSETSYFQFDKDRLCWAVGCAVASYRTPGAHDAAVYPAALSLGVFAMTAYQWSADESLRTVAVIGLICLGLGLLRPHRIFVSSLAIGSVVAVVNSFEAVSGLRPVYETHLHTLPHCARWMVLVAPALIASTVGGLLGRGLRTAPETVL